MGVTVSVVNQDYSWHNWAALLCVASKFNWEAVGAVAYDPYEGMEKRNIPGLNNCETEVEIDICDTYFYNYMYVTPKDAASMGLALKRAKDAAEDCIIYSYDEVNYAKSYKHLISYAQPLIDYCLKEDQRGFTIS